MYWDPSNGYEGNEFAQASADSMNLAQTAGPGIGLAETEQYVGLAETE